MVHDLWPCHSQSCAVVCLAELGQRQLHTNCHAVVVMLLQRLAYFPQEAAKELSKFSLLVVLDASKLTLP